MKICGYCHFECKYGKYEEFEDMCPLNLEENKNKDCYDIDCDYDCDCDNCITIREG